jgi:hypothetical protein
MRFLFRTFLAGSAMAFLLMISAGASGRETAAAFPLRELKTSDTNTPVIVLEFSGDRLFGQNTSIMIGSFLVQWPTQQPIYVREGNNITESQITGLQCTDSTGIQRECEFLFDTNEKTRSTRCKLLLSNSNVDIDCPVKIALMATADLQHEIEGKRALDGAKKERSRCLGSCYRDHESCETDAKSICDFGQPLANSNLCSDFPSRQSTQNVEIGRCASDWEGCKSVCQSNFQTCKDGGC